MEIYMIRHGETDWNKKLLIQGQTNNKLNVTGQKQAHEVSEKLNNLIPTKLYSSPLSRACETMNILAEACNWKNQVEINDSFTERNFGEFEGKIFTEYKKAASYDLNNTYESNEKIEKRVNNGLKEVIKSSLEKDIIVITAHSHTLKAILVSNFPSEYDYNYSLPNCAIVHLRVTNNETELVEIK